MGGQLCYYLWQFIGSGLTQFKYGISALGDSVNSVGQRSDECGEIASLCRYSRGDCEAVVQGSAAKLARSHRLQRNTINPTPTHPQVTFVDPKEFSDAFNNYQNIRMY